MPRKSLLEARKRHAEYLRSLNIKQFTGLSSNGKTFGSDPNNGGSTPSRPTNIPSSQSIPIGGGFLKSVDDYKWKRSVVESPETIKAIEEKKRRVAPAYNKGALQYINAGDDLKTLGRKV